MKWSFTLFKIRGVDVKVHLTFLLILVWAAYRWSNQTGAGWQGALFGAIATLLLFVAVTLHELGHSFQAMKFGVRVKGITLMPLGGLAQMDEIPEKPAQELRIAIAGPLVSFTIAGLLMIVGIVLQVQSVLTLEQLSQSFGKVSWSGMLAYLTMSNLALGFFNLIPAFPMDGGRVLRALLAMKMDYSKATAIAVAVGKALAVLLGLWGLIYANTTLVLIAFFVWTSANQEGKTLETKGVLHEIKVRQAMTRTPLVLSTTDPLERAIELTLSTAQVDFPVIRSSDGSLAGLLTHTDVINGLRLNSSQQSVSQFMQTRFPTTSLDESLFAALQRMAESRVQVMPVIGQDGRLNGLLTAGDINEAYRMLSAGLKLVPVT